MNNEGFVVIDYDFDGVWLGVVVGIYCYVIGVS